MTNPQGTQWESEIVARAQAEGFEAARHPKRGQKDEPDVWIGAAHPDVLIPVVAWKRLVGKRAEGRRKPDGERDVVVMSYNDFLAMASQLLHDSPVRFRYEVQAKWAAALNVTRVLHGLRQWLGGHNG